MDPTRQMLRHIVATLAYRAGKVLRDAPGDFSAFQAGPSSRTPVEILAHMGDLLDWAISMTQGTEAWHSSRPQPWNQEVSRFFKALDQFDTSLASSALLMCPPERLLQGPIADALTHVGQLAMLRRLVGAPVRGENYSRAVIEVGRVGPEQHLPRREFD